MNNPYCLERGLIHIYSGDGKGKTTAAIGLAVRCLGSGLPAVFCQFLKGVDSCELAPLKTLGATVMKAAENKKFFFEMSEAEKKEAAVSHLACFKEAAALAQKSGGILVLDEILDAVNCGLIPAEDVTELLRERSSSLEIVLTGRNPSDEFIRLCDYHTDLVCIKHPYKNGITARKGIEY